MWLSTVRNAGIALVPSLSQSWSVSESSKGEAMIGARLVQGTLIHEFEKGMVQVGSNPAHSVVFSGLSPIEVGWLRSLADRPPHGRPRAGSLSERQTEALALLDTAGLLVRSVNPMHKVKVRIGQMDEVGVRVAKLLAESRAGGVEIRDGGNVDARTESLFPREYRGLPTKTSVRRVIKAISPSTCTGKIALPDVAVVCSDRVFDHGVLGRLLSCDTAHIPAVSDDRSVTVGPVVIPGRTACSLCLDLHRRDNAPGWVKQCGALQQSEPAAPVPHIAATAAGIIVGLIDLLANRGTEGVWMAVSAALPALAEQKDLAGGASPVYHVTSYGVETRACFPHPDCGCLALAKAS